MLEAHHALHTIATASTETNWGETLAEAVYVWRTRVRLQVACRARDLAMFDLALNSQLRGCDLVMLRVSDLMSPAGVKRRVIIQQRKTSRSVPFEVTEQTRRSIAAWLAKAAGI
jgi:integrase